MIGYTKNILAIALMAMAAIFTSCEGKEECSLDFEIPAAFVSDWGESTTLKFTSKNAKLVEISSTAGGWQGVVNQGSQTLTITAPNETTTNAATQGSVSVSAVSKSGETETVTISTYIIDDIRDLSISNTQANCYIINQPNVKYSFNASVKGNSTESIPTAKVDIVWTENNNLMQYIHLDSEGYANFYVNYAKDENNKTLTTAPQGNAVVAAYDSNGTILWSWHLWFVGDSDPRGDNTLSNGTTIMDYNLGATTNPAGSDDTATIWNGYGLYYQWGRKDPFPRPEYYDCAMNLDETIYNANGGYTYLTIKESNATIGTIDYAVKHPKTFITSPDSNNGNWLYNNNRNDLWSNAGAKSLYDPCPHGWRVPSKDAFAVLDIATADDSMPLEQAERIFGWNLADSGNGKSFFFTANGYRSYYNGVISNINYRDDYPYTPKPWVGYYWTAGEGDSEGTSSAMFFELNTSRAVINAYKASSSQKRGNGMQVRCVKE